MAPIDEINDENRISPRSDLPSAYRGGSVSAGSSGAESVSSGSGRGGRGRRGEGLPRGEGGVAGDDESGRSDPATSLMPGSAPPPPHQSEQSQW